MRWKIDGDCVWHGLAEPSLLRFCSEPGATAEPEPTGSEPTVRRLPIGASVCIACITHLQDAFEIDDEAVGR